VNLLHEQVVSSNGSNGNGAQTEHLKTTYENLVDVQNISVPEPVTPIVTAVEQSPVVEELVTSNRISVVTNPVIDKQKVNVGDGEKTNSTNKVISKLLLDIVSDKTGYPVEMLELDMDMEADLGIDSIKRVEILGTLQDEVPELPEIDTDHLSELRTLSEILAFIDGNNERQEANDESIGGSGVKAQLTAVYDLQPESSTSLEAEGLKETLLDIVSEKTGYPAEMLELDMDMEADLGIDSIKRVEILGALQDGYPGIPEIDADTLTDLRTLQQILSYIDSREPALKKV
jgi:acyl carrier protein